MRKRNKKMSIETFIYTMNNNINQNNVFNILDPNNFFHQLNFKVDNKDIPDVEISPKYFSYITNNLSTAPKLRLLANFSRSMKYFHYLCTYDIFPFDKWSCLYKFAIAFKLQHLYNIYYNILKSEDMSYTAVILYYICTLLKKKIRQYKQYGKEAFSELMSMSDNDFMCYIHGTNSIITNTYNANRIHNILYFGCYFKEKQFLLTFLPYIQKSFDELFVDYSIDLITIYCYLYECKILTKEFEDMLYNKILDDITRHTLPIQRCDYYIERFYISSLPLIEKLYDYKNSFLLLKKLG